MLFVGSIKSLDDEIGVYAIGLRDTPVQHISIRNVLQMNVSVTPAKPKRRKTRRSKMAMGMKRHLLGAQMFCGCTPFQGYSKRHLLHLANSIIIMPRMTRFDFRRKCSIFDDIIGVPNQLHKFFSHSNLFKQFGPNGKIHWAADKMGRTVSLARLVMTLPTGSIYLVVNKAVIC